MNLSDTMSSYQGPILIDSLNFTEHIDTCLSAGFVKNNVFVIDFYIIIVFFIYDLELFYISPQFVFTQ